MTNRYISWDFGRFYSCPNAASVDRTKNLGFSQGSCSFLLISPPHKNLGEKSSFLTKFPNLIDWGLRPANLDPMRACYASLPSAFSNHRARWGHSFPGWSFFLRSNWWTLDSSLSPTRWKYSQTCHENPQVSRWNTRADTLRTTVHWHTSRSITAFFSFSLRSYALFHQRCPRSWHCWQDWSKQVFLCSTLPWYRTLTRTHKQL